MAAQKMWTFMMAGLLMMTCVTEAGPINRLMSNVCYLGCLAERVACFSSSGAIIGTVPYGIIAVTPALNTCNAIFKICKVSCIAILISPRTE